MAKKLPDEILIYEVKDDNAGISYFQTARNVDEIPVEHSGGVVGVYVLNKQYRFKIKREMK